VDMSLVHGDDEVGGLSSAIARANRERTHE
jgi:hypothetical protein